MVAEAGDKRAARLAFWSVRLLTFSSRVAALFATRISRLLIILLFVGLGLYVAYRQAWQPVLATAPLPPGVAERSPQLNTDLLKTINTQRVERIESLRHQFAVDTILRPPPPAPTP